MLPLTDDPGVRRTFPFINVAVIVANFAVFSYELSLPQGAFELFVERYAVVPADLIAHLGAPGELLTIFTAMFMHGGIAHVGFNMLYLWVFGDNVEDAMGHLGYAVFYLLAGVIATIAQVAVDPGSQVPNVGASGAIAGVLGAYLVLFPGSRVKTLIMIGIIPFFPTFAAVLVIGFWALTQFLAGFASFGLPSEGGGVAYFAHIGGFLTGLVLAKPFGRYVNRARGNIPLYPVPRT